MPQAAVKHSAWATRVARRLAVILAGALIFQKALTALNGVGVALSLGGVLAFLATSAASPPRKQNDKHSD